MKDSSLQTTEVVALTALAAGIIPADVRDAGAAAVNAGSRLAEKLVEGVNVTLYRAGLTAAVELARLRFCATVNSLTTAQLDELLGLLRQQQPAFFRQLRADVCALYLSDPGVCTRIGFPGPSTARGGYPDFDQPQG